MIEQKNHITKNYRPTYAEVGTGRLVFNISTQKSTKLIFRIKLNYYATMITKPLDVQYISTFQYTTSLHPKVEFTLASEMKQHIQNITARGQVSLLHGKLRNYY